MIEVRAPSRLHFGLLAPAPAGAWANVDGEMLVTGRQFGGIGLLVDEPGLRLHLEPSKDWSARGPMADRALDFARRFAATLPPDVVAPHSILIEEGPPEHCGLGTGTQLGISIAKALAIACGRCEWNSVELAKRVGRGLRSAVGIHGFDRGGLIVEGGKRDGDAVATLLACEELPDDWRVIVMVPKSEPGLHGTAERLAFDQLLGDGESRLSETLCRLVLLGMLPALRERDCRSFGEALYDFNARVGEQFSKAQGGRYASLLCTRIVEFIRKQGIAGVGQSSWGPALFAVVEDETRSLSLARQIENLHGGAVRLWVTRPSRGAVVRF
jgi:beta-ribofuranosylaminobenzene 5'-phosphate synthase